MITKEFNFIAPKTPEEQEVMDKLDKQFNLVKIGEHLILYRANVVKDFRYVETLEKLKEYEVYHKVTRTLHPEFVKQCFYALPFYIGTFEDYNEVPDKEKEIVPKEVFDYFKSRIEYSA